MFFDSHLFDINALRTVESSLDLLMLNKHAVSFEDLLDALGYVKCSGNSEKDLTSRAKWRQARSVVIMMITSGNLPKYRLLIDSLHGDITSKKDADLPEYDTTYPKDFIDKLQKSLEKYCVDDKIIPREHFAWDIDAVGKEHLISSAIKDGLVKGFAIKVGAKGGVYKLP